MTYQGPNRLEEMVQFALEGAKKRGADFTTVIAIHEQNHRDRIIDGEVRQPLESEGSDMQIVVWKNGRMMTHDAFPQKKQIGNALDFMFKCLVQETFPPTDLQTPEGPHRGGYDTELVKKMFDKDTSKLSPQRSVKHIREVQERLDPVGLMFDGVLTQNVKTMLIATSHGTWQKDVSTSAGFSIYAFDRKEAETPDMARLISAFAHSGGHRLSDIKVEKMVQDVMLKCKLQRDAVKWNPFGHFKDFTGEEYFDIIAEPPFIGPILTWLFAFCGFNAKPYLQGESFLSGKMGKQVFGENITLWDDPFNPRGVVNPFDWEGVPKKKLLLVERGVLKNICFDTTHAKLARTHSTGHAIPASAAVAHGTFPNNVFMEGGNATVENMIRDSRRAILVSKVHYMGMKHFQTGTLTGTAHHGVFLVENGELVRPVEDLRFEMQIPEALRHVTHLGEPELIGGVLGGEDPYVIPPMRIEGFRFIGATGRTK